MASHFETFPNSDVALLEAMNEVVVRPYTLQEMESARDAVAVLEGEKAEARAVPFLTLTRRLQAYGVELRNPKLDRRWKALTLSANPVEMEILQGGSIIRIDLPQDPRIPFNPFTIYNL